MTPSVGRASARRAPDFLLGRCHRRRRRGPRRPAPLQRRPEPRPAVRVGGGHQPLREPGLTGRRWGADPHVSPGIVARACGAGDAGRPVVGAGHARDGLHRRSGGRPIGGMAPSYPCCGSRPVCRLRAGPSVGAGSRRRSAPEAMQALRACIASRSSLLPVCRGFEGGDGQQIRGPMRSQQIHGAKPPRDTPGSGFPPPGRRTPARISTTPASASPPPGRR